MSNLDMNATEATPGDAPITDARRDFIDLADAVQQRIDKIFQVAQQLTQRAAELGVIIEIAPIPLQPPAMGNYGLEVHVRPSRPTQHVLAELEAAAIASEQAAADQRLCEMGIHSWTGEEGRRAADTPCAHCGELYGTPE